MGVRRCQPEVGEVYVLGIFADEDVLWFKVAVVDSCFVARRQCVHDLEEEPFDESVVPSDRKSVV